MLGCIYGLRDSTTGEVSKCERTSKTPSGSMRTDLTGALCPARGRSIKAVARIVVFRGQSTRGVQDTSSATNNESVHS